MKGVSWGLALLVVAVCGFYGYFVYGLNFHSHGSTRTLRSPDGAYEAEAVEYPAGDDADVTLRNLSLPTTGPVHVIFMGKQGQVGDVRWEGPRRLVVQVSGHAPETMKLWDVDVEIRSR